MLEIAIRDSQMTGRAAVGVVRVPLRQLPMGGQQNMWLPVQPSASGAKVSPHISVIVFVYFICSNLHFFVFQSSPKLILCLG